MLVVSGLLRVSQWFMRLPLEVVWQPCVSHVQHDITDIAAQCLYNSSVFGLLLALDCSRHIVLQREAGLLSEVGSPESSVGKSALLPTSGTNKDALPAQPSEAASASPPSSMSTTDESKGQQLDEDVEVKIEDSAHSDPGLSLPTFSEQPRQVASQRIRTRSQAPRRARAPALSTLWAGPSAASATPVSASPAAETAVEVPDVESWLRCAVGQRPTPGQKAHQTLSFQLPEMFVKGGRFWLQAELDDCTSAPFALPTYSTVLEPEAATHQQVYWRRYMYPAALMRKSR